MEVGTIIISPTRELATQISEILEKFLEKIPSLKQVLLVGGVTLKEDAENLKKGVNIIVATPGRLEDILSNCSSINLNLCIKSLVMKLYFLQQNFYVIRIFGLIKYTIISRNFLF